MADQAVLKVRAFEPADVRLLEGPFKKAFDDNTGFLLKVEADRLLHRFLAYNGLAPKGELYGGWEAEGLSGHSLGHYLSACALAYASSGDRHVLDRVTYIVDELASVQEVRGDGYVGGIPNQDALFRDFETGNFFSVRQNYINNFWAPWYTIHKIFAGLLDAHRYCRNEKALSVAERYGRWAARITRNLDDAAWHLCASSIRPTIGPRPLGDWDAGSFKWKCGLSQYVAGVSVDLNACRPHSILCCNR